MTKKISELTNEEIFKYVYALSYDDIPAKFKEYKGRPTYPENENQKATNITYDNCRYCDKRSHLFCGLNCNCKNVDFDAVRTGIYKDDEIEIYE